MNILSLFDVMSCGQIAFKELGMKVNRYVAYEIDKYPIKVTQHNYPNTEQMGDVFTADFTQYKGFDWLIGGSPCTYWSIAQKNNRETVASGMGWELFSQYVRALKEAQPQYFLYENNKSMSNAIRESITETFGFEPICINSALVSAQNRQRLYWVGIRQPDGTYKKADVQQPNDRGVLLKDILETFESADPVCDNNGKSKVLTASYGKHDVSDSFKNANPRTGVAIPVNTTAVAEPVCVAQRGIYSDTGNRSKKTDAEIVQIFEARTDKKTNALTTVQKDNMVAEQLELVPYTEKKMSEIVEKYGYLPEMFNPYNLAEITDKAPTQAAHCASQTGSSAVIITEPVKVGCLPSPDGTIKNSQGMRIYSIDGKSVTQSAQGGGLGAKTGLYAIPATKYCNDKNMEHLMRPFGSKAKIFSEDTDKSSTLLAAMGTGGGNGIYIAEKSAKELNKITVYEVKDGKITIKGKQYPIKLKDGYYIIRKLTVTECKRLQTIPKWYDMSVISNSQAYKCLGNGWTVEVIKHLINSALKTEKE